MARLHERERRRRTRLVQRTLYGHPYGLRECELASELGWQRRTVNNYLRELRNQGLAHKDGRDWFVDE
jgi:predicted transcriptional regulator